MSLVHQSRIGMHVSEYNFTAAVSDDICCRGECKSRHDDIIARSDIEGLAGKMQRGSARIARNRKLGADGIRKGSLELCNFWARREDVLKKGLRGCGDVIVTDERPAIRKATVPKHKEHSSESGTLELDFEDADIH